jgi:hypothetical protein
MRRAMLIVVTLVSLLLLAIVTADWAYSLNNSETIIRVQGGKIFAIDNFNGEAAFWIGWMKDSEPDGWHHEHWPRQNSKMTKDLGIRNAAGQELWFAGFGYTSRHRFPVTAEQGIDPARITGQRGVVIPSWFMTLAFTLIPTITLLKLIRSFTRRSAGRCAVCGYDLRASPDRCPECGTVPAAAAA